MVVPNGTLFGDGVCARIKEELLKEFNLQTIVRLPNGVFSPYTGIPTNLLFFDRSGPTKDIWYYEQPKRDGANYSKSKPMHFEEFDQCLKWWKKRAENERAWKIRASDVIKYDSGSLVSVNLDVRTPHGRKDLEHTPPDQLVDAILAKENTLLAIVGDHSPSLKKSVMSSKALWPEVRIGDVLTYLDERIDLDNASEYITITVRRRHGGLEERDRVLGHQIKSNKQFRLIPGAFIISRVQCWHEAYAIVRCPVKHDCERQL
jgi:hypothetical protein